MEECSHTSNTLLGYEMVECYQTIIFQFVRTSVLSPPPQVRFHADTNNPTHPQYLAHSDRYLEVKVNGEWGLVCYEPLTRSDLNVLCRDLQGKFGQRSRPSTASYYKGKKR